MKLGKLKRVDLREYWKHEALHFTQWLAEPENTEQLSDEIGISIQITQTEASVGSFNADILAVEETTGRIIIIENQLEKTDHSHLGQLITYASGLEAEYIIWIVREAREEHQQAVDWLNENTTDKINFFLVVIELWQIGDSPPAPKFNIISRPNEWKRSVRTSSNEGDLTDTKAKQLEFWKRLKEYVAANKPDLKMQKPRPQHWYVVTIGRSDRYLSLVVDSQGSMLRCELYIPDSKDLYNIFYEKKVEIEKELGVPEPLEWQELPGKKASRIRITREFQVSEVNDWESAFVWLTDRVSRFKKVFAKDWTKVKSGSG